MKKYSFVVSDITYEVQDQFDLIVLLKVFAWNSKVSSLIHWNILMEIDFDLVNIIKDYSSLLKCLNLLNEKNWYLLLVKLADNLLNIVKDSKTLWEILSKISTEQNKQRLLSQLRIQNLSKIISLSLTL